MKTTILVLMTAMTMAINHSVFAGSYENVMPPPGPYKSVDDTDQYTSDQSVQNCSHMRKNYGHPSAQSNQLNSEVPDWVKQRQAQMEQRMKQSNMQSQNRPNQQPQWNYNQMQPAPNTYSGRAPGVQDNRFQQPFPSARGPVYGPGAVPPEYYQQPMYQGQRY
ncbi:MAG: hypothetical protein OEY66_01270 [Gammaproteobacteria bacterium]|nr:hypothetical protein [Gammaproteobacteria bacterium]